MKNRQFYARKKTKAPWDGYFCTNLRDIKDTDRQHLFCKDVNSPQVNYKFNAGTQSKECFSWSVILKRIMEKAKSRDNFKEE